MSKIAEIEENFKAFDTLSVDFLFLALKVRGGRLLSEGRGRPSHASALHRRDEPVPVQLLRQAGEGAQQLRR